MRPSLHFAQKLFMGRRGIIGVEVGVDHGWNSREILTEWEIGKLYGVDISEDSQRWANEELKNFPNFEFILGDSSEVAARFPDETFDFVYLDDDHDFGPCVKSLTAWYPKVKPGGIISGHDYNDVGVYNAVKGFFATFDLLLSVEGIDLIDWWGVKPLGEG